jgi:hypothetical protein
LFDEEVAMHYGRHPRQAFCDWIDEGCPPLATVEVNYRPRVWTAEQLLQRMLNCSDITPGSFYAEAVETLGLQRSRQTYGSVVRELLLRLEPHGDTVR